jgi:DNA-binding transcriptional LysR family regulator
LPNEPFVVLVRKGHPAARRRLNLERYLGLDHLLIAPRGLPGSLVDAALERLGKARRVTTRIQHFSSAPYLVARSDLALTCPASVAAMARPFFALRTLSLPLELEVDRTSMVWHERAHRDPSHTWFRTRVSEHFRRARG